MLRKGYFAKMNGREYPMTSCKKQFYLKSKDRADLQFGFVEKDGLPNEYVKKINVEELEDAYEIFLFAMLKSYRFAVKGYNKETGLVELVTSNPFVRKKVDVLDYKKDEYIIELPYEHVLIEEDKVPISGFENIYQEQ